MNPTFLDKSIYPWALCRLGAPDEKSRVMGRFTNRADAENSRIFVQRALRLIQADSPVQYVVVFDPPG